MMGLISAAGGQTVGPASGGKVTPINNVGTTAAQVIGPNQYRAVITFHNPGTNNVFVAPVSNASGAAFTPSNASPGGAFLVYPGNTLILTGEVQTAWQAFANTGSANSLTVMESNL